VLGVVVGRIERIDVGAHLRTERARQRGLVGEGVDGLEVGVDGRDGASKEKAARIANAQAAEGEKTIGRRGGKAGDYEDWTVDKLRKRAAEIGIEGRSDMRKGELIDALRNH
jgi:uncharacterized protein YdbL (DUF1318 family)